MPTSTRTPVVFIHGLWLHASSWQPWCDLFEAAVAESATEVAVFASVSEGFSKKNINCSFSH